MVDFVNSEYNGMVDFVNSEYNGLDPWYWHLQRAKQHVAGAPQVAQVHALIALTHAVVMVQDRLAEIGRERLGFV